MSSNNYAEIFAYLLDDPKWSCEGPLDEYDNFTWLDSRPQPSKEDCDVIAGDVALHQERMSASLLRQAAFQVESDPLFFGWQRNENTEQDWRDKVEEIRARYPYPS